jgi:NAD(P)-dependent dehydrogenase (short-subunit alcohol dehydrogenase family)
MIKNMKDAFSVKNKNVLVTGGNRGIGEGIVQAFAQSGSNIAIMAHDKNAALEVLDDVKQYGGKYVFYEGDVTGKNDCQRVIKSVRDDFGRLDVLVNNAGIDKVKRTLDLGPDFKDWYDVIDVNLNGLFLMCYYAAKIMKEQGGGNIINILSISAFMVAQPQYECSYNASKAAAAHLTESLAVEWSPYNIRVNGIAPGYADTPLLQNILNQKTGKIRKWYDYWKKSCPTDRFLQPIEVGAMCVYLTSEAADYCRGSIMVIDGGYRIPR